MKDKINEAKQKAIEIYSVAKKFVTDTPKDLKDMELRFDKIHWGHKAVGVALEIALLTSCIPRKGIIPKQESNSEGSNTNSTETNSTLNLTETPVPNENIDSKTFTLRAEQNTQTVKDFAKDFESKMIIWYDEGNQPQSIAKGADSEYTLLGVSYAEISNNHQEDTVFGYVAGNNGDEHLAQKLQDGNWVILQFNEYIDNNTSKLYKSFGYYVPVNDISIFIPSLSVESTSDTTTLWFFDYASKSFYKESSVSIEGGKAGLMSMVQIGNEHILKGIGLMQNHTDTTWNFKWQEDGNLAIVNSNTEILFIYNAETKEWESAEAPIPPELVTKFAGTGYEPHWKGKTIVLVDANTKQQIPELSVSPETAEITRTYKFNNPAGGEEDLTVKVTLDELKNKEMSAWKLENNLWVRKNVDHTDPKTGEEIQTDIPEYSPREFVQIIRELTKQAVANGVILEDLPIGAAEARKMWGLKSQYDWTISIKDMEFQMFQPEDKIFIHPPFWWHNKIYDENGVEETTIPYHCTSLDKGGKNGYVTVSDINGNVLSFFLDISKLNMYGYNLVTGHFDPSLTPFRAD